MGGVTPLLDGFPPPFESPPQDEQTPIRRFPKIFGNKNAMISDNSPGKIDPPPFRNLGLCCTDLPP